MSQNVEQLVRRMRSQTFTREEAQALCECIASRVRDERAFHAPSITALVGRIEIRPRHDIPECGFAIGSDMDIIVDGRPLSRVGSATLRIVPGRAVELEVHLDALGAIEPSPHLAAFGD